MAMVTVYGDDGRLLPVVPLYCTMNGRTKNGGRKAGWLVGLVGWKASV